MDMVAGFAECHASVFQSLCQPSLSREFTLAARLAGLISWWRGIPHLGKRARFVAKLRGFAHKERC